MAGSPVNRRAFLGRLAALPIAGSVLKQHAAKLAGASGLLGAGAVASDNEVAPMRDILDFDEPERGPRGRALVEILRFAGIPQFKKDEWDHRARWNARHLDPDIAALHSISLSAAMQMQYKRNRQRYEQEFFAELVSREDRNTWLKRIGLGWL